MLSFEYAAPAAGEMPEELQIVCDREGLSSLLNQLQFLTDARTEHVHLMRESWGGNHLSEKPFNPSATPIRHVKILLR